MSRLVRFGKRAVSGPIGRFGSLAIALLVALGFAAVGWIAASLIGIDGGDVRTWLIDLRAERQLVFLGVVGLLAVDSVLSVPTLMTVALAGFLLGPAWGGVAGFAGVMMAGSICFWGGRFIGSRRWIASAKARALQATIGEVGPAVLLVARVAPMLPETVSALAGAGGMPAARYYLYFALGNLPFAFLVAYAGSVSSLERPLPVLLVAVSAPTLGALVLLWRRRVQRSFDRDASAEAATAARE